MTRTHRAWRGVCLALAIGIWASGLSAQTAIKLAKNTFTPSQDVELGREAAAEVQ